MLNDQELRNCIFRGVYNDFIREQAANVDYQTILDSPTLHERMLDSELVLRFFAFYHTNYLRYKSSMKQFLNNEMISHKDLNDEESKELSTVFKKSVRLTRLVFGKRAFRRLLIGTTKNRNSQWEERKVNRGLFDILMFGFTLYEEREIIPRQDAIREELLWLSTADERFVDALSGSSTDRKDKVQLKFETWISSLRNIVGYSKSEPRSFSWNLKKKLWEANPVCAEIGCQQRILDPDDAEVDHIEFYWRGGKTIEENARLIHRYCNRKRGGGSHTPSDRTDVVAIEDSLIPNTDISEPRRIEDANQASRRIFDALRTEILQLGPDVKERSLQHWQAYVKGKKTFMYMQTKKTNPEVRCRVFGFVPPLKNPKGLKIEIWKNSNGVNELVMRLKEDDIEPATVIISECYSNLV